MRQAIRDVVTEVGSPLRKGQVRSWRFFEDRAAADYVDVPKGA
jgi:hypothetical protein